MARNGYKMLNVAGNCWKLLGMANIVGNYLNGWKWLDMSGNDGKNIVLLIRLNQFI